MRGFSYSDYISQVDFFRSCSDDIATPKITLNTMALNFKRWIDSLDLVNRDQGAAVLGALKEAVLHDSIELNIMDGLVMGTWKSSYGSGTFGTSSARKEEIRFKPDHTYSFHGVRTISVTRPPVGGSPYPQAYATSGSTSNEHGIYMVCSPRKLLLLSNHGGVRFARYNKVDYARTLSVDGAGVFGT